MIGRSWQGKENRKIKKVNFIKKGNEGIKNDE